MLRLAVSIPVGGSPWNRTSIPPAYRPIEAVGGALPAARRWLIASTDTGGRTGGHNLVFRFDELANELKGEENSTIEWTTVRAALAHAAGGSRPPLYTRRCSIIVLSEKEIAAVNFREGMRRVSIVLGLAGGSMGGILAHLEVQSLSNIRAAYRKFESVMASPTMQRVSKEMSIDYDALAKQAGGSTAPIPSFKDFVAASKTKDGGRGTGPFRDLADLVAASGDENGGQYLLKAHPLLKGNRDGISKVHIDSARLVSSVELSTGESVPRTEPPQVKAYLLLLLYPVLGFLLPLGFIRLLAWVGTALSRRNTRPRYRAST